MEGFNGLSYQEQTTRNISFWGGLLSPWSFEVVHPGGKPKDLVHMLWNLEDGCHTTKNDWQPKPALPCGGYYGMEESAIYHDNHQSAMMLTKNGCGSSSKGCDTSTSGISLWQIESPARK
jgi:hypothetical protein